MFMNLIMWSICQSIQIHFDEQPQQGMSMSTIFQLFQIKVSTCMVYVLFIAFSSSFSKKVMADKPLVAIVETKSLRADDVEHPPVNVPASSLISSCGKKRGIKHGELKHGNVKRNEKSGIKNVVLKCGNVKRNKTYGTKTRK